MEANRCHSQLFINSNALLDAQGRIPLLLRSSMQLRRTLTLTLAFIASHMAIFPLYSAEHEATDSRGMPSRKGLPHKITQPLSQNPQAATLLKQANQDESSGNIRQAMATYRRITKQYTFAYEAPEAQFLMAKLLQRRGELRRAFDAFQILIIRYPEAKQFDEASGEQIKIANHYLKKRNNFTNILMSNVETAQHMYEKILASAPFGHYAPLVQFNLGLAYERQGRAQDAVQAYQTLIDRYPNSSVVNNAQYQIAYVYMRVGLSKNSQDLSALLQARDYFQDYTLQHPNSERAAQIDKNMRTMGVKESSDIYNIAKFYDRYRNYKSAYIYYNDVIRRQSGSPQALLAKTRVEAIRSEVGDDALRTGPDKAETGKMAAMRRRLQAQVETQGLSDYAGPSKKDIIPDELPAVKPRMRTGEHDVQPLTAPSLPHP